MKKLSVALILLLGVALLFTACSEEISDIDRFVGEWTAALESGQKTEITFEAEGEDLSGKIRAYDPSSDTWRERSFNVTERDGYRIAFLFEDGVIQNTAYRFNGDELTVFGVTHTCEGKDVPESGPEYIIYPMFEIFEKYTGAAASVIIRDFVPLTSKDFDFGEDRGFTARTAEQYSALGATIYFEQSSEGDTVDYISFDIPVTEETRDTVFNNLCNLMEFRYDEANYVSGKDHNADGEYSYEVAADGFNVWVMANGDTVSAVASIDE